MTFSFVMPSFPGERATNCSRLFFGNLEPLSNRDHTFNGDSDHDLEKILQSKRLHRHAERALYPQVKALRCDASPTDLPCYCDENHLDTATASC